MTEFELNTLGKSFVSNEMFSYMTSYRGRRMGEKDRYREIESMGMSEWEDGGRMNEFHIYPYSPGAMSYLGWN